MCGIAGSITPKTLPNGDIALNMIQAISYRGPDEIGAKVIGPCALSHARLAIVDKENGGQPMSNHDETVWVVFNGEIFNFIELREELKAKGYIFKSRCDTEVLVHLWREKGEQMLEDLVGMFAFCLWDDEQQRGIIARDRQGIKPCYYWRDGNQLLFASEIKAILACPQVNNVVKPSSLGLMHAFNYCPPPQTCYENIYHLEPGHYISFDNHGNYRFTRYWEWPLLASQENLSFDEFDNMLDESIRLQMRFDVDGALFLSGGVDSSIIAHKLIQQWNRPRLLAYALDCDVPGFGEFSLAKTVADRLNIDLQPVRFGPPQVEEKFGEVIYHADQPHGDFSFILIKLLCERANADDVIVAFNGDGPDEALIGFGHNEAFFSGQVRSNFSLTSYFKTIRYMDPVIANKIFCGPILNGFNESLDVFEDKLSPWRDLEPLEQISAYELTSLMPGNNLIKGDRMGAGESVEGRSPFLDHRISERFVRLGPSDKLASGIGKKYLKEFGLRFLPEDHLFRKKSMPTLPIGEWIKGPLASWARDRLSALPEEYYNREECMHLLTEHQSGRVNYTRELRTLLASSTWFNGKLFPH